jgi:hypothetical protein
MDDETPTTRPHPPRAEPAPGPTESELSRIARAAVHQEPDARLDKELARMGLTDPAEPATRQPRPPTDRPAVIDPELERLRKQLQRTEAIVWVLLGVSAILAVLVVVLLFR